MSCCTNNSWELLSSLADSDIPDIFDEEFIKSALEYDRSQGFQPVSPVLHPAFNDASWLDDIPVLNKEDLEMKELRSQALVPGPKTVDIGDVLDLEETILHHIRRAADWYTTHGPAPRTLEERWTREDLTAEVIVLLIYYQIIFFGDDSVSPWQFTFYTAQIKDLQDNRYCTMCGMLMSEWCLQVVPRS